MAYICSIGCNPIPADGKVLQGPKESLRSRRSGKPTLSSKGFPSPNTQTQHAVFREQAERRGNSPTKESDSSQQSSVPGESPSQCQFWLPFLLQDGNQMILSSRAFGKTQSDKNAFYQSSIHTHSPRPETHKCHFEKAPLLRTLHDACTWPGENEVAKVVRGAIHLHVSGTLF